MPDRTGLFRPGATPLVQSASSGLQSEPGTWLWHRWQCNMLRLEPVLSAAVSPSALAGDRTPDQDLHTLATLIAAVLKSSLAQQHIQHGAAPSVLLIDATTPGISITALKHHVVHQSKPESSNGTPDVLSAAFDKTVLITRPKTSHEVLAALSVLSHHIESPSLFPLPRGHQDGHNQGRMLVPLVVVYARSPMFWIRIRPHERRVLMDTITSLSSRLGTVVVGMYLRPLDRRRWAVWLRHDDLAV
ncbi:hypothetical protein BC831DRAFT_455286 [Entophlyctis helioformis]|nr:hypothetical protein BC831DRAFT_455286 [Entophlyctis helioformis]